MTDLAAIVRATRASANAIRAMRIANQSIEQCSRSGMSYARYVKAYRRAWARYEDAQAILRANPLPGDDVSITD